MSSDEKEDGKVAQAFQKWIDQYARDVELFIDVLQSPLTPPPLKRLVAAGLNYQLRQVDLVPDYYKPIGLIDDCIILRVVADLGAEWTAELGPDHMREMFKLANDCDLLKEYLGDVYRPLENAVRAMEAQEVHRRSPEAIASSAEIQKAFVEDLRQDLLGYKALAIQDGPRAERELLSYFKTKLGKREK